MADSHSVPGRGMSRYHSAGVPFHDSLAHQESVSVRLHDGPYHRATASVQLHDSVPYDDGTMRLHENSRLVEILHEENTTLKRELETYYQRVCKLMRVSPWQLVYITSSLYTTPTDGARARETEGSSSTSGRVQQTKRETGGSNEI